MKSQEYHSITTPPKEVPTILTQEDSELESRAGSERNPKPELQMKAEWGENSQRERMPVKHFYGSISKVEF